MKPRIRKRFGIWTCALLSKWFVIGHGFTPAEAYADWMEQQ